MSSYFFSEKIEAGKKKKLTRQSTVYSVSEGVKLQSFKGRREQGDTTITIEPDPESRPEREMAGTSTSADDQYSRKKPITKKVFVDSTVSQAFREFLSFSKGSERRYAREALKKTREKFEVVQRKYKRMKEIVESDKSTEYFFKQRPEMFSRMDFLIREHCLRDSNIKNRAIEVLKDEEETMELQNEMMGLNLETAVSGSGKELITRLVEKLKARESYQNAEVYREYREALEQAADLESLAYREEFDPVIVTLVSVKRKKGKTDLAKKFREALQKHIQHGFQSYVDARAKTLSQRVSDIFNVREPMGERSSCELAEGIIDPNDDLYPGPCTLVLFGRALQLGGKILALIELSDNYKDNIIQQMNATVLEGDRGPDCMETFNNEWSIANGGTTRDESLVLYRGQFSSVSYDPSFHPENLLIPLVALGISAVDPLLGMIADAWNSKQFKREQEKHGAVREENRKETRKAFERSVSSNAEGYKVAVEAYDITDPSIIIEYLAFSHLSVSDAEDLIEELEELKKLCGKEKQQAGLDLTTTYTTSIFSGVLLLARDFYYLFRYGNPQGLICRCNMHVSSLIYLLGIQILMPRYAIPVYMVGEILNTVGYVQSDQPKLQGECYQWVQEEFNAGGEKNRTILDVFYAVYNNESSSEEKERYLHTDHEVSGSLAVRESVNTTGTDVMLFFVTAWGDQVYQVVQLTGKGGSKLLRKIKKSCGAMNCRIPWPLNPFSRAN